MVRTFIAILTTALSFNVYSGFTLNTSTGAAFEQDEVYVNIADNCQRIGSTATELMEMVTIGIDRYWNQVPTSRLELKAGTVQSVSSSYYSEEICQDDGSLTCTSNPNIIVSNDILISCNDSNLNFQDSDMNVIATTVPNNATGRVIHGALMIINDRTGNQFSNLTREQMIIILAHELGHAIGLGHTSNEDALMYYRLRDITRDNLSWEDVDGLTYLYPARSPDIGSCATISTIGPDNRVGLLNFVITFFAILAIVQLVPIFSKGKITNEV